MKYIKYFLIKYTYLNFFSLDTKISNKVTEKYKAKF